MIRVLTLAAFAAVIAFAAPAQARMANPGLVGVAPANNVEQAQYYYYGPRRHYRRHHHWRQGFAYYPRRCWTERIRTWNGHVRYVRRCR
jgi:hypothetical protein